MKTMLPRLAVCACVVILPSAAGFTAPIRDTVTAVLLVAVMIAFAVQRRSVRFCPNPATAAVLVALAIACLQCVPLPSALLALVSRGAAEIYAVTRPEAHSLPASLDVPTTAHWLVKLVALYAAAVLAPVAFGSREERRWLSAAVALGGVLFVVTSFLDGDALEGNEPLRGALTNPNHAGTYLGLAAFFAVAGWIRDDEPRWPIHAVAAVVCGAGVFMTLSRGAAISFVIAAALAMMIWWRGSQKPFLVGVVLAASALVLGGLAYWVYTTETAGRPAVIDKSALWPVVLGMVPDFAWLGVGRGAFATVFTRYTIFPVDLTFTHVENEYLQTVIDFGVPGAALLLGLLAWQLVSLVRGAKRRTTMVLVVGLLFVASRDLADFGASRLAIAVPCVLMMSALAAQRRRPSSRRWRHVAPVVLAVVVLLAVAAPFAVIHELARDTRSLAALPVDAHIDARALIDLHPADFVMRAVRVERRLNARVLDRELWHDLNAALYLAPLHATPHRLAGRALFLAGHREQALGEYRAALRCDPSKAPHTIAELENLDATDDQIASLADEPGARESVALHFLRRGAPARAMTALASEGGGGSMVAMEIAGRAALALGQNDRALGVARALQAQAPAYHAGYELEVLALRTLGNEERAELALRRGLERVPTSRELAYLAFESALTKGSPEEARGIARAYLARATRPVDMAQAHLWAATTHQREGNHARALRELERARELAPSDGMVRVALVRAFCSSGDVASARRELAAARSILGHGADTDALEQLIEQAAKPL